MIGYYTDIDVRGAIVSGLLRRGIDVFRAQDDGYDGRSDSDIMDRATELGRVLISQDDDMLNEADQRLQSGIDFSGLVYAKKKRVSIGQGIEDAEYLAQAGLPEDFRNRVYYLPL